MIHAITILLFKCRLLLCVVSDHVVFGSFYFVESYATLVTYHNMVFKVMPVQTMQSVKSLSVGTMYIYTMHGGD